jgi:outer membrane protein assembly factor BamB
MAYPREGRHWLGAFDLASGDPLWETSLRHDVITAPVVAEGHVFLSTFDGTVWSIDPSSGAMLWERPLDATSAPWAYRGEVYVARRTRERRGRSGREARATTTTSDVSPSPTARPRTGPAEETTAWDAKVGEFKARHEAKEAAYLLASWGAERKQTFWADDAAVGFAQGPAAAKLDDVKRQIGEVGVARTWRFQGSRPVVVDGVLYETTGDRLEASDVATRQRRWGWSAAKAVEGERRLTPPAVARGRVLAGTWDGRILSWDAADGEIVWEVEVGAPCHWQPVMAGGWVYAGLEDGSVVAFDTRDPDCDGWPMWGGGAGHNGQSD